jgi:hypothetical protein
MTVSLLLAAACVPAAADEKPRVYTNEDLARMAPYRHQTGVDSKPAAPPAAPPGVRPAPRESKRDERYWRQQADRTAEQARKLREQAAVLADRIEERRRRPGVLPYSDAQVVSLEQRRQALEARAREAELRLEERARREGALPGWLR